MRKSRFFQNSRASVHIWSLPTKLVALVLNPDLAAVSARDNVDGPRCGQGWIWGGAKAWKPFGSWRNTATWRFHCKIQHWHSMIGLSAGHVFSSYVIGFIYVVFMFHVQNTTNVFHLYSHVHCITLRLSLGYILGCLLVACFPSDSKFSPRFLTCSFPFSGFLTSDKNSVEYTDFR